MVPFLIINLKSYSYKIFLIVIPTNNSYYNEKPWSNPYEDWLTIGWSSLQPFWIFPNECALEIKLEANYSAYLFDNTCNCSFYEQVN